MENVKELSTEVKKNIPQRIKAARSIAGYAERKAFCHKFGFPLATLEAWERGKNLLTSKGARRLVDILRGVGIYCSEEWLLEGKGISPRPLKEFIEEEDLSPHNPYHSLDKNLKIAKEISTFITLNEGAHVTLIRDDAMLPFYEEGDYVGGIRKAGSFLSEAVNKRCIIELLNGNTIVRQLYQGKDKGSYNISAINLNSKKGPILEQNVEILSAAPIIWHRAISL